jgi:hypothetical protein
MIDVFSKFSEEISLIGQILLRYSTLELDVCNCVSCARDDYDTIFKAFFRSRGESQRLGMADILGRHRFKEHRLETEFAMCISYVKTCLKVRNCYAHCIWWNHGIDGLAFANLENIAESNSMISNLENLRSRHGLATAETLSDQIEYFKFTEQFTHWLGSEVLVRSGKRDTQNLQKPRQRNLKFQCKQESLL